MQDSTHMNSVWHDNGSPRQLEITVICDTCRLSLGLQRLCMWKAKRKGSLSDFIDCSRGLAIVHEGTAPACVLAISMQLKLLTISDHKEIISLELKIFVVFGP